MQDPFQAYMKRPFASSTVFGSAFRAFLMGSACLLGPALRAQDTYEPDNTSATAKMIGNGELQNRSIDIGDEDWLTFTIGAPGAVNLRIETAAQPGFSGDTEIWLYDSRNLTKELAYNDNASLTNRFSLITLNSLAAGTYYIRIKSVGVEATIAGYVVRAGWTDNPDAFEPDDTPGTSKRIPNGEAQERSLHVSSDVDWAVFSIGSNGATDLRIETSGVVGDTEIWLFGPNSATAQLAYNDDASGGKFSLITLGALEQGTYVIKVQAFSLGSTISGYTLRASWSERGDSFEQDDTPAAAKPIANGETQSRTLHVKGDVDWATFTIGTNGASNVRIETTGASGDTELFLYGPNSSTSLFAYNDDIPNGKFSLITLNSLPPGTYLIKVSEYGNDSEIPGYSLRASWAAGVAPAPGDSFESDDTPQNAKAIANGQTQNRSIHVTTDVDWALFTIPTNGANNVRIESAGNSGDTEMWLYGPNNFTQQLSYNDDGGGSGRFAAISLPTLGAGTYYVKVSSHRQGTTIPAYSLSASWSDSLVTPVDSRLVNLSIRTNAGTDAQTVIVGFVVAGAGQKPVLLRGIGPALGQFGVTGFLPDPSIQLFAGTTLLDSNDNWGTSPGVSEAGAAVAAFPLPDGSRDSALLESFIGGNYSAQISGGTGVVLVEAYDAGTGSLPRLVNVSARAQVGTGAGILIAGFVVDGVDTKTVLIRGIGPGLTQFGVTGVLADPRLDVYRGTTLMQSNDNWGGTAALTTAFSRVGAFTVPATSRDAALVLTLEPGAYSAQISGVGGTTGAALVEIYEIP